jgi:phosphoribosylamine--glycine ligase
LKEYDYPKPILIVEHGDARMKVLVIGQGGREHALARALTQAPSVSSVHALPGSQGLAQSCICHSQSWEDFDQVLQLIQREKIELVVIGPETPLAAGLSDHLRDASVPVVGPSKAAAALESSKIFSKRFMVDAGAPTAHFHIVSTVAETMSASASFAPPYVLKADGLAAGKGVFICKTSVELQAAAVQLFEAKSLGVAGARALLEEFTPGYEISYLILTNGSDFEPLVLAQDHKRLFDGDEGPNTGGMGVVAPVAIDANLRERINREVIAPVLQQMTKEGLLYRGILYVGLMINHGAPSVIEFNVRFGDPEAQVILPLLEGDWGQVFLALAKGRLTSLTWKEASAACIVLAAEGYPEKTVTGAPILGDWSDHANGQSYFLHAGTTGRVLNSVGLGPSLRDAVDLAYQQLEKLSFKGQQFRRDIGARLL